MIWVNAIICMIKAAPGCQKSSPSYKFNSLNFDSEKISETTLWDHLKWLHRKVLIRPWSKSEMVPPPLCEHFRWSDSFSMCNHWVPIGVYDTMRQIFIRVHLETKIMFWLATHLALVQLTHNNDQCLHETGHFQDSIQSSVIVSGCKMHNIESVWVNITLICLAHYWPFTGHLQWIDVSIWKWSRGCITFLYASFQQFQTWWDIFTCLGF